MRPLSRVAAIVLLTVSLVACAARAQVLTEVEVPLLDPPPPPPRVVAVYTAPEPPPVAPTVEPAAPVRPPARPPRPEQKPEPATTPEPVESSARPSPGPSLTLTPSPGSESQTAAAIRDLLERATRDLSRVNPATLNADRRSQFDTARRFIQQAEEALKVRNIVFASKLLVHFRAPTMDRLPLGTVFLVVALAIGCGSSPTSPSTANVAGKWGGSRCAPALGTACAIQMTITQDGSALTGTWGTTTTSGKLTGTISGLTVTLTLTGEFAPTTLTLTLNQKQDEMSGPYTAQSTISLTRQTA
jgi:hypothetical protein